MMKPRFVIVLLVFTLLSCQTFRLEQPPSMEPVAAGTIMAGTFAVEQAVRETLTAAAIQPTVINGSEQHILELALQEQSLESGQQASWTISMPAAKSVLLFIEARVDWPSLAGLAYLMEISVNDLPLTEGLLLNKPPTFTFADGRTYRYYGYIEEYSANSMPFWGVFYSPDYESNDLPSSVISSGYSVNEGSAYTYLFDITTLISTEQTQITLLNRGEQYTEALNQPIILMYRQLKLFIVP